jgi:hypothetical protein
MTNIKQLITSIYNLSVGHTQQSTLRAFQNKNVHSARNTNLIILVFTRAIQRGRGQLRNWLL